MEIWSLITKTLSARWICKMHWTSVSFKTPKCFFLTNDIFSEHKYHLFAQINNKSLRGAAGFLSHCKGVKVNIHDASTCYHFAVWSILDGGSGCDLDSLRAERELRICEQEPRRGQGRGAATRRSEESASVLCGWSPWPFVWTSLRHFSHLWQ